MKKSITQALSDTHALHNNNEHNHSQKMNKEDEFTLTHSEIYNTVVSKTSAQQSAQPQYSSKYRLDSKSENQHNFFHSHSQQQLFSIVQSNPIPISFTYTTTVS